MVSPHAESLAAAVAVIATLVGGAVWVGTIDNRTAQTESRVEKIEAASPAVDIGVLKASQGRIEMDIAEIKAGQRELLDEIRKESHDDPIQNSSRLRRR